jgi:hypothetical protein
MCDEEQNKEKKQNSLLSMEAKASHRDPELDPSVVRIPCKLREGSGEVFWRHGEQFREVSLSEGEVHGPAVVRIH